MAVFADFLQEWPFKLGNYELEMSFSSLGTKKKKG